MEFTIIDADAHHLDGPAYKAYLPERFRVRSGPYFPSFGWDIFLNGTTGRKPANPEEYCKDLDVEKIGDAVAYPSNALAIGLVREFDLAAELAKAYNNWACDFCKSSGNRIKYAAVIAPQVVPEAVKEVRRPMCNRAWTWDSPSSIQSTPKRRSSACRSAFTPQPRLPSATLAFINISASI